jgi:hypothetical protein
MMAKLAPPAGGIQLLPSGGMVPANLLRLHVRFDHPPDVELASAARLLDATGTIISHAFLDLPGGLWSADGLRLTLMLHPGRIKSGLTARESLGVAVAEGQELVVEIETGGGSVRLPLVVGPAVTTPIDPDLWDIREATPGTREPLMIMFDRVMDAESIATSLALRGSQDQLLLGRWQVRADGRSAVFLPNQPWPDSGIRADAAADLEDVAGNRPGLAFEMPIKSGSDR